MKESWQISITHKKSLIHKSLLELQIQKDPDSKPIQNEVPINLKKNWQQNIFLNFERQSNELMVMLNDKIILKQELFFNEPVVIQSYGFGKIKKSH